MFSNKIPCPQCKTRVKEDFDFCPYCGLDMRNPEQELRDYGFLGKNEKAGAAPGLSPGFGLNEGLFNSIFNQLMKSFETQMKNGEITQLPNGIQIKIGMPQQKQPKARKQQPQRVITHEQVKRMAGAPRVEAKTDIRRLSDKVVYEMKAPDINSVDDIFVSKVESGYEVKAIGHKKVYVNNMAVDLPLRSYSLSEKGVVFEFGVD